MGYGLVLCDDPNIGGYTRVVKAVVRKLNDGIQPVIFYNVSSDFALTAAGISCEKRRAVLYDRHAAGILQLGDTVQHKEHLPVRNCRQTRAKTAVIAQLCLVFHFFLFSLPVNTERWIRNNIVKCLVCKLIIRQGISIHHT